MRARSLTALSALSLVLLAGCQAEENCGEHVEAEELDLESISEEEFDFLQDARAALADRGHGEFIYPVEVTTDEDGSRFSLWQYERQWFSTLVFIQAEEIEDTLDMQLGADNGSRPIISQNTLRSELKNCGPGFTFSCESAFFAEGPMYFDEKEADGQTWYFEANLVSGETMCWSGTGG